MKKFLKKYFTPFGNLHYMFNKTTDSYLLGDIKVSLNILIVLLGLLCVFSVVGCAGNNQVWPGNCYLHQDGLTYSKVHTVTDGIVLYDVADTSLDYAEFKFNRRSEYDFLSIYKQKVNCSEFQKAEQKTELILIINQKIEKMKDRISYLEDLVYSRTKK